MRKALTLAALMGTTMLATPVFAADQQMHYADKDTWYLEFRAGAPIPRKHDFVSGAVVGTYEPDTGFHGAVSIGKYLNDNWRAEFDISLTHGSDGLALAPGPIPHTGDVDVLTFMAAVLYDFNTSGSWTPFVGVGLGLAHVDFDNLTGGGFLTVGDDVVFAVALKSGVSVPISDRLDFTARYELAILGGGDYAVIGGAPGQVTSTSTEVEHIFSVGFRINLN